MPVGTEMLYQSSESQVSEIHPLMVWLVLLSCKEPAAEPPASVPELASFWLFPGWFAVPKIQTCNVYWPEPDHSLASM